MKFQDCVNCSNPHYEKGKISILCPTRSRPENVLRFLRTAKSTAAEFTSLEFLFFVDADDQSFPAKQVKEYGSKVKIIRGPRQWLSNAHNILYNSACGEMLMTAGDDMTFEVDNWDNIVRAHFENSKDKISLLFGDDKATHSGKLAVHGFFHQHWVHVVGTWVQPGRGSLWDLWSYENASILKRLTFEPNLVIPHLHYRQGTGLAIFDQTYEQIYKSNRSFRPEITFRLLERERRIDRILLKEAMDADSPIEKLYFLSEFINKRVKGLDSHRLLSMTNSEILLWCLKFPFRTIANRFSLKK